MIYVICKHNKLRALVTSLALQQVKEVKAENKENIDNSCECTIQHNNNDRSNCVCNLTA